MRRRSILGVITSLYLGGCTASQPAPETPAAPPTAMDLAAAP